MFLTEPEQPCRKDHRKRIERKRAGFLPFISGCGCASPACGCIVSGCLQSRENSLFQIADAEQDDQGQERDQDLRARVEGAVQQPRKYAEDSEQKEKDAVFAEVLPGKPCQYRIEAEKGHAHPVFVEQQVIQHRIRREQLQKGQQGHLAAAPAVFQEDKCGGEQQGSGQRGAGQGAGEILFQKRLLPERAPLLTVPVPAHSGKSGDRKVKAAEADQAQAEREPTHLFLSHAQQCA